MKKIILVMLIIILVVNPVGVYASSASAALEVTGSLASGGLAGGAQSEKLAIAFTLIVMSGLGMSVKLSEQAKAAGETAQSYIKNLYARWVGGTSATQLTADQREELKKRFKVIATGGSDNNGNSNNKFTKRGKIFLAAGALGLIGKFLNWLKSINQIHADADLPGEIAGTLYSNICIGSYGSTYCSVSILDDSKVVFVKLGYKVMGYRPESYGTFQARTGDCEQDGTTKGTGTSAWANFNYGMYYYISRTNYARWDFKNTLENVLDISTLGYTSFDDYLRDLGGEWGDSSVTASDYIDGTYNGNELDNPNNSYAQIDPALYQQLLQGLNANTLATINIADYVNAILQQLNKQSNPSAVPSSETVPVVDSTDLSPIPQPLPDPVPDPAEITLPEDEPVPGDNDPPADSDPVSDPDPAPPDVSVPKMMIPLDEYFPFCIPFDVYHLLQKLSADPVAPSYTIGFTVYGTEVNYTISLDAFSGAMVIVRRMELFVCVVGLAIASRKIFTR